MSGLMAEFIMELGWLTRWKEREYSRGLMAENMMDIMLTIRKMAMAFLNGLMEGNIRVSGRMENSMEMALILIHKELREMANGVMGKD